MVGAESHAASGSASTTRPKTIEPRRHRRPRSHLPLSIAVNLTDPELDSRLIRIFPHPGPILTGHHQVGTGLKESFKGGRSVGQLDLVRLSDRVDDSDACGGRISMALAGVSIRARIESRNDLALGHVAAIQIGVIGTAGLLLAALHGVEAALWAAAYWWLGALNSLTDAILYSVDSMSTLGASGLTLEPHWRMMGALEGMDGMLLFGISTAYIFAVMQA